MSVTRPSKFSEPVIGEVIGPGTGEPIIRLSTMRFEESAMMDVDLDAQEFEPELPLIAHSDLSLPLVREPSPVIFTMETISETRSSARRTAG